MKIRITGGHIVDPAHGVDGICDVFVLGRRIATQAQFEASPGDERTIDATGLHVFPGLVDMHCHLREPGYEYKETILTGTRAAVRGGFTGVACMANTLPVADSAAVIELELEKARAANMARVYPIGAVTKGLEGKELAEIGELKHAGAVALSDDGKPVSSGNMMRLALRYAKDFDMLIISHCEDLDLLDQGVMNEGYMSTLLGLRGANRVAEEVMISRDASLAEEAGARVHIAHVSTRGGVEIVRRAKARGVAVTCETTPHYIAATDALVEGYDTAARVNPPLRTDDDRLAIIEGLLDGTIDCIATDHAPHHRDDKAVEFQLAASGISGFETAFALCYTELVRGGHMTLSDLIHLMSPAPARILGLNHGTIAPGAEADIAVADLSAAWTIDPAAFESKGKNTPFAGRTVNAKVVHTLVAGDIKIFDGRVRE